MKGNLLVISNAAMCQSDSNGRTISRLLDTLSTEQKAQFYVYGCPDFLGGHSFYNVTDRDALNSFIKRTKKDGTLQTTQTTSIINTNQKKVRKTPFKMILREFIWKHGCWDNKYLDKWLNDVNPSAILVVAGDNAFTLDFTRKVAKKRSIPIILYSTEDYPFKNYNYITKKVSLFYFFWHLKLKKAYQRMEKYIKAGIFNTEALTKLYKSKYSYPCYSVYQSSDIDEEGNYKTREPITISYLGNLGLNRHKALIQIGEALNEIDSDIKLDIYGKADEFVIDELKKCPSIRFKGFVGYEEVVNIIHHSTLLLHAEYRDKFYTRDLKYAFSTKIADSICSGTPFLIYAPNELVETQFLRENDCAFVVSEKSDLKNTLVSAIFDEAERKRKIDNAKIAKEKYFTNVGQFEMILKGVLNENPASEQRL